MPESTSSGVRDDRDREPVAVGAIVASDVAFDVDGAAFVFASVDVEPAP